MVTTVVVAGVVVGVSKRAAIEANFFLGFGGEVDAGVTTETGAGDGAATAATGAVVGAVVVAGTAGSSLSSQSTS